MESASSTQPLILRPSRLRSWALILTSAGFVAGGLFMAREGEPMGRWVAGFFAFCLIVAFVNALPSASQLRLDRQGFEVRSLFRRQSYRWADIASFGVASVSGATVVTVTFHQRTRARTLNSLISGTFDGALPNTYGLSPDTLAALLEDWKLGRPHDAVDADEARWLLGELSRSARSGGGLLGLKLAALFSFCGGPLFFADVLDVKRRGAPYFAVPFAPIALLLFGALALKGDESDTLGRWSIEGGLVGATALMAMNVYATLELVLGPPRADGKLLAFGIAVGFGTAAVYVVTALRFLREGAH